LEVLNPGRRFDSGKSQINPFKL